MRRFIVPFSLSGEGVVSLEGDLYRHIVTVLRLREGDLLLLADPSGLTRNGTIAAIGEGRVAVRLGGESCPGAVSPLRVVLMQGMPKGDKMELIIQKATELGISRIVAFPAERSVARIPAARLPERLARWRRIGAEAARQSGAALPEILVADSMGDALELCDEELRLLPWEGEKTVRLGPLLAETPSPGSVALMIGPEGGFAPAEVSRAAQCGFRPVSLGPRILRTETAGFALIAVLQQVWGDMG